MLQNCMYICTYTFINSCYIDKKVVLVVTSSQPNVFLFEMTWSFQSTSDIIIGSLVSHVFQRIPQKYLFTYNASYAHY